MFLVGLFSWWYGRGWVAQLKRATSRISGTLEFFSVGQLLSTLFSPFRQISASGSGDGSFGGALRAFADKLISRIIGSIIRTLTILIGLVVILFQTVYQTVIVVAWLFVPLMPIAGGVLYAIGWMPAWM